MFVRAFPRWRIAGRVLAATVGAYFVTAGSAALAAVVLILATGISRSDALIAASVLGYLLFAFLMLWCFAERRLLRVWLVLIAAAVLAHGLAISIERLVPVASGQS